jgi:hypothetical protein
MVATTTSSFMPSVSSLGYSGRSEAVAVVGGGVEGGVCVASGKRTSLEFETVVELEGAAIESGAATLP